MVYGLVLSSYLAHWIENQDQPQAIETHGAREAAVRQELQDLEKARDFCGDFSGDLLLAQKKTRWSWDGFMVSLNLLFGLNIMILVPS